MKRSFRTPATPQPPRYPSLLETRAARGLLAAGLGALVTGATLTACYPLVQTSGDPVVPELDAGEPDAAAPDARDPGWAGEAIPEPDGGMGDEPKR